MAKKLEMPAGGIIRRVKLSELKIDPIYQRGLKPNHKHIASKFDRSAAGVLHVGNRGEGGMWLIDGQQRREAMTINGIHEWDACVIPSSGSEYEAGVFEMLNGKNRAKLTARELFRAQLAAGSPVALAVSRAVAAAGLSLNPSSGSKGWPQLACVATLCRQCECVGGEATLTRALRLMASCWPKQDDCMRDVIPAALCMLIREHGESLDDATLIEASRATPPIKIINDAATSIGNRYTAAAAVILGLYNKKAGRTKKLRIVVRREEEAAA